MTLHNNELYEKKIFSHKLGTFIELVTFAQPYRTGTGSKIVVDFVTFHYEC